MSELSVGSLSGLAANSYVIDVASGSTLDLSNATDLPASALPAGSILQVQSAASTTTFSTSSTSFVLYTGVEVSITPSSASNTVMIFANVTKSSSTSNGPQQFMEVQRGGSGIFTTSAHGDGTNGYYAPMVIMFEDSPASTSAQTYSLDVRVNGGTGSFEGASITVMEVAG